MLLVSFTAFLLRFTALTPAQYKRQSDFESEHRSENESQFGLQHDSTRVNFLDSTHDLDILFE